MDQEEIQIIYINDDYFSPQLGVSLLSLREFNKFSNIHIHYINTGMSEKNLTRIFDICNRCGFILNVYDAKNLLDTLSQEGLVVPTEGNNISTLVRVFMFKYLPSCNRRYLYIDTDTIINGNIEEIYSREFNKSLAAVLDANYDFCTNHLTDIDKYFNAGVLLINTDKYIEKINNADIINMIARNYPFADQDILNIIFRGDVEIIEPKYNASSRYRDVSPKNVRFWAGTDSELNYSMKEYIEAHNNPVIIHFTSSLLGRPWESNSLDPDNNKWRRYYNISPWSDIPLKEKKLTKSNRTGRFLYKYLTGKVFCKLDYFNARHKYLKNGK